jgi:hypothetical protein
MQAYIGGFLIEHAIKAVEALFILVLLPLAHVVP